MGDTDESAIWVQQLVAGEDRVVAEFWSRYGASLERLAQSRMTSSLRQRVGADDIVQSVCRTLFRRGGRQQFELQGSESLWRLLCAITLTKVRQHARFHYRQRRNPNREQAAASSDANGSPPELPAASTEPTPAEAIEFAEEMERLLGSLSEEERQLIQHRLEGLSQPETAEKLGCSERTVRRLLESIRNRWKSDLDRELQSS